MDFTGFIKGPILFDRKKSVTRLHQKAATL